MALTVRQACVDDLPAAVRLFEERDGCSYAPEQISRLFGSFEPQRSLAWLAFDGSRAVGMTMMLIRELEIGAEKVRAGYWANLFVHQDYRHYLLYPRLTRAMTAALRPNDVAFLYTAVRHADITRAHVSLGFAKLGELKVRGKPLRPLRLFLRARGWKVPESLVFLPDVLYSRARRFNPRRGRSDFQVRQIALCSGLEQFAALLGEARAPVRQNWTAWRLRDRYRDNREAEPYLLLGALRNGHLLAGALWRAAVRDGSNVRAGVLLDLAFQTGEHEAVKQVIAAAEVSAVDRGCDVMLHLDGLKETAALISESGYFLSPASYSVLLWPARAARGEVLGNLQNWRYPFAEHDTF